MKVLFIFILIVFPIKAISQTLLDSFYKPIDKYKIQRIDSIQSVYIIYIEKGDETFKIASPKSEFSTGVRIRKGKFYNLQISSYLDASKIRQKLDIGGITVSGVLINLEGENIVWDLFHCKNLNGLYLKKDNY